MDSPANTQKPFTQGEFMRLGRKAFLLSCFAESGGGLLGIIISIFIFLFALSPAGIQFQSTSPINLSALTLLVLAVSIVLLALTYFVTWLWYINYEFCVDEHSFEIKRGILSREELSVPYRQIQDVNIDQTLFYRIIGLAVVRIITAGEVEKGVGGNVEQELPALEKSVAEELRKELLERTNVQEVVEVPKSPNN